MVSADVSKQQLTVWTRVLTLLAWKRLASMMAASVEVQTFLLDTETEKQQDVKLLWHTLKNNTHVMSGCKGKTGCLGCQLGQQYQVCESTEDSSIKHNKHNTHILNPPEDIPKMQNIQ